MAPTLKPGVDVALCASFLFTFDASFHVAVITEPAGPRSSFTPSTHATAGASRTLTDAVERGLSAAGLCTQIFLAPSTWRRGASTMRIST